MMPPVIASRFTARQDDPFVVFLIGMRVNKFFAFRKWLSVAKAFPEMVAILKVHPEKGFLHGEIFFRLPPLTIMMLSYWKSFEDLERFARSVDDPHLAAWRRFNQQIGSDGSVGIFHETYAVAPGSYETFYNNMPLFGLSGATQHALPVLSHQAQSARGRMHAQAAGEIEQPANASLEGLE